MTVDANRTREPDQVQAMYLEKLADELSHRGLEAWLMAPPGRVPSLYVVNPAARALEENVYAGCGKDGMWWFWWSWAERIAVADDIDLAASTIVRVLASDGVPGPRPAGGTRPFPPSFPPKQFLAAEETAIRRQAKFSGRTRPWWPIREPREWPRPAPRGSRDQGAELPR
jgi:hypothetical protein